MLPRFDLHETMLICVDEGFNKSELTVCVLI
jgi:hypothetical protein